MSISVWKLNADTTFLFTFSPESSANDRSTSLRVLVDPWLSGDSSWLHPSFQFSSHTVEPAVSSLKVLVHEVDLIVISQDKPDHCHKETLCSWPQEKKIDIFAAPAAAKKIREWKYFDASRIHDLSPYNAADQTSLRVLHGPSGIGELTLANLSSRKDLTGLHNAIAFTYRMTSHNAYSARADSAEVLLSTPPESPTFLRLPQEMQPQTLRARIRSYSSLRSMARRPRTPIASPPHTPDNQPCLSCIYTPHGLSSSLVEPYLHNHLALNHALPLTLLVHSMVLERNPWFMGGVVAAGAPGGTDIIKMLGGHVKCWVAAHDEEKDNRGMSVKLLRTKRYGFDEVRELLHEHDYGHVKLASLDAGQELRMPG